MAIASGSAFGQVAGALRDFAGAERRFERHGEAGGVVVVDDYGHHPTEIAAVLAAARATLNRRLIVVFQPHRYSRTAQLLDEFGPALKDADEIVLTDIYAASEEPIPGITLEALADAVRRGSGRPVHVVPVARRGGSAGPASSRVPGDAVITLGAGSIGTVPREADGRAATPGGGPLMPVAAPADKRFRRSHVHPGKKRRWIPSWRTVAIVARRVGRRALRSCRGPPALR